jgi:hypothetical protein
MELSAWWEWVDQVLWERMARAGVRAGFQDRVAARKYLAPR